MTPLQRFFEAANLGVERLLRGLRLLGVKREELECAGFAGEAGHLGGVWCSGDVCCVLDGEGSLRSCVC